MRRAAFQPHPHPPSGGLRSSHGDRATTVGRLAPPFREFPPAIPGISPDQFKDPPNCLPPLHSLSFPRLSLRALRGRNGGRGGMRVTLLIADGGFPAPA